VISNAPKLHGAFATRMPLKPGGRPA
jgi:hypothetical protein